MADPLRSLVLATRNAGKVAELARRLGPLGVALVSATDVPGAPTVEEDAPTLAGNAEKKARALAAHAGQPALADDTGLEVDALGGAPGVRSARFASDADDDAATPEGVSAANRALLLARLDGQRLRTARFRTVLAFVEPAPAQAGGDALHTFDGVCEGTLADAERGAGGFGYDALFVPDEGDGRTFAEMTTDEKNRISHRGRALDAFVAWLGTRSDTLREPP